jgi:hypothetical protein
MDYSDRARYGLCSNGECAGSIPRSASGELIIQAGGRCDLSLPSSSLILTTS